MLKHFFLVILGILAIPFFVFAHPGNTDSAGGHTCSTNCASYGLYTGQYHFHPASCLSTEAVAAKQDLIRQSYSLQISNLEAETESQVMAYSGQLGVNRRASDSANAFIEAVRREGQQKINDLILKRDLALQEAKALQCSLSSTIPANAELIDGRWLCKRGFFFYKDSNDCLSIDTICRSRDLNSYGDPSGKCLCSSGYTLKDGKCVTETKVATSTSEAELIASLQKQILVLMEQIRVLLAQRG